MNNFLTVIICATICCAALVDGVCPEWNENSPCSCNEIKSVMNIHCSAASSSRRVTAILSELQPSSTWELQIDSMNAIELPPIVTSVSSLGLKVSNLQRLLKFEAITWPNLNEVVIESVTFRNSLWPQLAGAQFLKFVKITDVIIPRIDQEFRENVPSSVEYIELRKTNMPLTTFPRNALPATMNQLHTFVLGNTQIEKLESNFFRGMQKLQVLMLNGNRFSTLGAHLFAPLQSHLNHFLAERNLLQCKCDLLWLKTFQKKRSMNIFATCLDPSTKQLKEIMDLQEEDYCF